MKLNEIVLMTVLLKLANTMGFNPKNRTRFANILAVTNYILMWTMIIANLIELVLNFDGADSLEKMVFISVCFMTASKCMWWLIKHKDIMKTLGLIDKMWPLDKFGPEELKLNNKRVNYIYWYIKIYSMIFLLTDIFLFIWYFINREYIVPGWYGCSKENDLCFYPIAIEQLLVNVYLFVGGETCFDNFFLTIVTIFYIETETIKTSFSKWTEVCRNGDVDDSQRFLREIIIQHHNIVKFFGAVKDLYQEIFFIQVSAGIYNLTFTLFMITYQGYPPDMNTLLVFGFLYACYALQLGNLCLGGTVLSEQMNGLATEAYNTEWYNQPSSQSRDLAMIILKAQVEEPLSGGGLIDLNLDTYTNVIMNSFKLCAAIKTIAGLDT